MEHKTVFEGYTIEQVELGLEVNYMISNKEGYVCRLVPGEAGFEVSPLDKSNGTEIPLDLLSRLSDFIVTQDA